ncbi:MAG: hypothetical protein JRG70_15855 [Deltaproteobacteria bacterium]|nr:hypothetical protein [Deltaproteobacteria bacterium]
MGMLKADLEAAGFELIETHISWVFLGAADVFKVKRPVDLGFLDFTTLEKRREACDAEVRLNRRLAPEVYIDVVPITLNAEGVHEIAGRGTAVEWAVHMRRLPAERRADELLQAGRLEPRHVDLLASCVSRFHEGARCDTETSRHGDVVTIRHNVKENFDQTRTSIGDYLNPEQARQIEAWQLHVLEDEDRFTARVDAGRVRDGHGDLRLEHVYFGSATSDFATATWLQTSRSCRWILPGMDAWISQSASLLATPVSRTTTTFTPSSISTRATVPSSEARSRRCLPTMPKRRPQRGSALGARPGATSCWHWRTNALPWSHRELSP